MNILQKGAGEGRVALIIGGVVLLGVLVYFGMGLDKKESRDAALEAVVPNNGDGNNDEENILAEQTDLALASSTARDNQVAFTLKMENISAEQRAFLKLQGIEGDEIMVTNAMVTCAEGKFGGARVMEIRNGASLSMTEKVQLLACYK